MNTDSSLQNLISVANPYIREIIKMAGNVETLVAQSHDYDLVSIERTCRSVDQAALGRLLLNINVYLLFAVNAAIEHVFVTLLNHSFPANN